MEVRPVLFGRQPARCSFGVYNAHCRPRPRPRGARRCQDLLEADSDLAIPTVAQNPKSLRLSLRGVLVVSSLKAVRGQGSQNRPLRPPTCSLRIRSLRRPLSALASTSSPVHDAHCRPWPLGPPCILAAALSGRGAARSTTGTAPLRQPSARCRPGPVDRSPGGHSVPTVPDRRLPVSPHRTALRAGTVCLIADCSSPHRPSARGRPGSLDRSPGGHCVLDRRARVLPPAVGPWPARNRRQSLGGRSAPVRRRLVFSLAVGPQPAQSRQTVLRAGAERPDRRTRVFSPVADSGRDGSADCSRAGVSDARSPGASLLAGPPGVTRSPATGPAPSPCTVGSASPTAPRLDRAPSRLPGRASDTRRAG